MRRLTPGISASKQKQCSFRRIKNTYEVPALYYDKDQMANAGLVEPADMHKGGRWTWNDIDEAPVCGAPLALPGIKAAQQAVRGSHENALCSWADGPPAASPSLISTFVKKGIVRGDVTKVVVGQTDDEGIRAE